MTYEEIVGYVKKKAAKADAKNFGPVAVQIDITGEGEGAFYVAVSDGKVDVQPYEYFDHNAKVVADGNDRLYECTVGVGETAETETYTCRAERRGIAVGPEGGQAAHQARTAC